MYQLNDSTDRIFQLLDPNPRLNPYSLLLIKMETMHNSAYDNLVRHLRNQFKSVNSTY